MTFIKNFILNILILILFYNDKKTEAMIVLPKEELLNKVKSRLSFNRLEIKNILKSFMNIIRLIFKNWEVSLSFIFLFACIFFHVNPFYTLEEIGNKQKFVQIHNELGNQYLYDGRFDAARVEFNRVLAVDTSNVEATSKLIDCDIGSEIENGTSDLGLLYIQLDTLKKEDSNDPFPYYFSGEIFLINDDLENAESNYLIAISKDKSFADAYNGLGLIYDKRNNSTEAIRYFTTAYDVSNGNALYANNVAETYYDLGQYNNAKYWYDNAGICDMFQSTYLYYPNTPRILDDFENASIYQEKQISYLNDNSTDNLSCNNRLYYLKTDSGDIVNLDTCNQKKCYAYYNLALTFYLQGKESEALNYLKIANDIQIDNESKSNVLRLIHTNINDLQLEQPKYVNKTTEFKNEIDNL